MSVSLTSEQKALLRKILGRGVAAGASPKELKAAVETAIVETNISNPSAMTDHDSQGWRQERKSLYPDPTNVTHSADRFFRETRAVRGKYGRAGDLAAAVQRPAAQYRGRYQQHSAEADQILAHLGLGGRASSTGRASSPAGAAPPAVVATPGVDTSSARRQLVASFLLNGGNDLAGLASQVAALKGDDTSATVAPASSSSSRRSGPLAGAGGGLAARAMQRADTIDKKRLPYLWGGGHGGKVNPSTAKPLDCSGAVSAVLGINPRVAAQFKTFGSPGRARGGRGVTIYAKDSHVLMEIDGRFWGTSRANPGGGAGWIPRNQISSDYLKGFTVRHLARSVH